ncbi:MAG: HD domain-containing protein, partial [Acetobacteraceae bacterium]
MTTPINDPFEPYQDLADSLLSAFDASRVGGSHDLSHIVRVWRNAVRIARTEPEYDLELLLAATVLHDCVAVEKSSPRRPFASRLSAARAREIVAPLRWAQDRVDRMAHAIETHSFSAGIQPETLEAKILRDADRLDAIGAIGIARCFHVGGRMGGALYHPDDPGAEARPLDDRGYALDHFPAKLFKVANGFWTKEGRRLASARAALMTDFVAAFL